jgi:hypothetical protein
MLTITERRETLMLYWVDFFVLGICINDSYTEDWFTKSYNYEFIALLVWPYRLNHFTKTGIITYQKQFGKHCRT